MLRKMNTCLRVAQNQQQMMHREFSFVPRSLHCNFLELFLAQHEHLYLEKKNSFVAVLCNPEGAKFQFCGDLDNIISSVPKPDKLILLGDFNARMGSNFSTWEEVLRKHGIDRCKRNSTLLLELCSSQHLLVTNAVFCLP